MARKKKVQFSMNFQSKKQSQLFLKYKYDPKAKSKVLNDLKLKYRKPIKKLGGKIFDLAKPKRKKGAGIKLQPVTGGKGAELKSDEQLIGKPVLKS